MHPKYQYNQSVWGTPNYTAGTFAASGTSIFQEKGITYDANGNIQAMQHTGSTGALADNFSYNYTANTNQLANVANAVGPTTYGAYTYDEIGRLKSQTNIAGATYLQYDVTGKITGIFSDPSMTSSYLKESYTYDESGNRIKTVNIVNNITTYYVDDANGNVLAIYTGTNTGSVSISEVPVYGSERLGTYFEPGTNYVYEIRDNVGSVRVAINGTKIGGQADIKQYNDYYPYGSIAQSGGTGYHYDYQGAYAEKDPVTGYNNFELRMYDSRIARWLSVDPAGQHYSPYEAMGNNPVTLDDPTGGSDTTCSWVGIGGGRDGNSHKFEWTDLASAQAKYPGQTLVDIGKGPFFAHDGDGNEVRLNSDGTRNISSRLFTNGYSLVGLKGVYQLCNALETFAYFIMPGAGAAAAGTSAIVDAAPAVVEEAVPVVENVVEEVGSDILANKVAGDAFRDELASLLEKEGFTVRKEVYKWTMWGKRYIDIEVKSGDTILGGIETKLGTSRYTTLQQMKDMYLRFHTNYPVTVVRGPFTL